MWKLSGTPKVYKVTQKIAKEWAEMDAAHTDRPLSERRMAAYRKMIADRMFRPVTWAKAFCTETNQWLRVNGKHTSNVFSTYPSLSEYDLSVIVEEYQCDTLHDVANLYSTFDSRLQSRNTTDINRSFSQIIPEFQSINDTTMINVLVSALSIYESGTGDYSHEGSAIDRAELLFDNTDFGLWMINDIFEGSRRKQSQHICRAPVIAAMKACWLKTKGGAKEFWLAVRDETGPTPDCPDRKLAKWLSTSESKIGGRIITNKRYKVSPREFYVKSLLCWNAWRSNTPTSMAYHVDAKLPTAK